MLPAAAQRPVRRGRSSWWRPFVGSAAPIAAFMATKGGGRAGPALRSAAKRPKQSGGWREPAILPRDVKRHFRSRRKIVAERHCVAGPLAAGSPSPEGRERGPLRQEEGSRIDGEPSGRCTGFVPHSGPNARTQEPSHVLRGELALQSCTQRGGIGVTQILVEISRLRR